MKKLVLFISIAIVSCTKQADKQQFLFQTSTINALLNGYYDGTYNFEELDKKGDFGIGTLNGLDGELIIIDNQYFQIKSDGKVYTVDKKMKTPFATTTYFKADTVFDLIDTLNFNQLSLYIDSTLSTKNIFYAIRIEGRFSTLKARSVPKQTKPYCRLVDVVADQPTFTYTNINGTLIGFRVPEFANTINVPGYHFHFISEDKSVGGHVLSFSGLDMKISIDSIYNLELALPGDKDFENSELGLSKEKELQKVEK